MRAARFDARAYEDIAADEAATSGAVLVVVLAGLSCGIGVYGWNVLGWFDTAARVAIVFLAALAIAFGAASRYDAPAWSLTRAKRALRLLGFSLAPALTGIVAAAFGESRIVLYLVTGWTGLTFLYALRLTFDFRPHTVFRRIAVAVAVGAFITGFLYDLVFAGGIGVLVVLAVGLCLVFHKAIIYSIFGQTSGLGEGSPPIRCGLLFEVTHLLERFRVLADRRGLEITIRELLELWTFSQVAPRHQDVAPALPPPAHESTLGDNRPKSAAPAPEPTSPGSIDAIESEDGTEPADTHEEAMRSANELESPRPGSPDPDDPGLDVEPAGIQESMPFADESGSPRPESPDPDDPGTGAGSVVADETIAQSRSPDVVAPGTNSEEMQATLGPDAPAPEGETSASTTPGVEEEISDPLGAKQVLGRLFGGDLSSRATQQMFADTFAGATVHWSGNLKRVERFRYDRVFSGGGHRALIDVGDEAPDHPLACVEVIVKIDSTLADSAAERSGQSVTFTGTLLDVNPYMRRIYVGEAQLIEAGNRAG